MRRAVMILSLAATPAAGDFLFQIPIDCTLGETCFIQQYLDHDPTGKAQDFMCGAQTYDGHKGTDFALKSLTSQASGVDVLAAADGTVVGVRNDMADVLQITPDAPDVSDRECGNGVVIRHQDGFESQYCHMARGSITVTSGQSVTAGAVLGQVGLSGRTQFPHLHLELRKNGQPVDPFNSDGITTCPDPTSPSLWDTQVPARAGGIVAIGLTDKVPSFDSVKADQADTGVAADGPAMVGWGHLFGVRAGDTVTTRITRPDGTSFETTDTLDRTQARVFRAFGKRTPQSGWAKGTYLLEVIHRRRDAIQDNARATYQVD